MFLPDPIDLKLKYFPDRPRIYIDIETTGLEPSEGACILSIGAMIQLPDEDGIRKEIPSFEYEVAIMPTEEQWNNASPKALEVNGMTWEYLEKNGVPVQIAKNAFTDFLVTHFRPGDKYFHVGQNPAFDLKFLRSFMKDELIFVGYPFNDSVNIIECFREIQKVDKTLKTERYNGHAISRALGVTEEDKVHTAMGGTQAVFRNYWALEGRYQAWVKALRQEVLAGNVSRALPLPIKARSYEEWKDAAKGIGWTYVNKTHFVDKDGQRYSCVWGVPPMLVKI